MLIWFFFGCYFWGLGAEGGQQQLKDANHDGLLEPGRADGRLKCAIRSPFTTFEGGQQQLKDANHDGRLEPGRWPAAAKKTRITTDSLSPGVQTEGSNSHSARHLQHLKVATSS